VEDPEKAFAEMKSLGYRVLEEVMVVVDPDGRHIHLWPRYSIA
jgi:hypothetical protein